MVRMLFAWSVLAVVVATAGCRVCAHPYDYCSPTFTGECGTCAANERAGSIMAGGERIIDAEFIEEGLQPMPDPAMQPHQADRVPPGVAPAPPLPQGMPQELEAVAPRFGQRRQHVGPLDYFLAPASQMMASPQPTVRR